MSVLPERNAFVGAVGIESADLKDKFAPRLCGFLCRGWRRNSDQRIKIKRKE